ncbi:GPALPP motifs-containing protein 1 [Phlebotomus argentipes]|uniref:GPALPP motifs-containing protein 1 n=1 Tax=Phlebotomus argentipes TaxID=94469 RepID=UPI002892BEDE|nr:GPALPP motifs-containing protein 1 [Phlebotomus argentipes]XP_059619670.1 GPALPP motifs-containing protein 1 [Phlebotomus argentipes]
MDEDDVAFGPALPPHLLKTSGSAAEQRIVGPSMPPDFRPSEAGNAIEDTQSDEDDDDEVTIGPSMPGEVLNSRSQLELEERALQMKLNALEGATGSASSEVQSREEWMTELPEVRKLSHMGIGPRQFRQKEGPDFSDRSSWTDTPQGKAEKSKSKEGPSSTVIFEQKRVKEHDKAMEKLKKKHEKEHKRKKSLLEMHQEARKKKKDKKVKEERRTFSREVDLAVNKFDETRKQAAIKKSQQLNNRFSAGSSKFL